MGKSSRLDIPLQDQRAMWNRWNAEFRETEVGEVSRRQAAVIERWIAELDRTDLDFIDVGCGPAWMSERLTQFGQVTGTDLAAEVIERARQQLPNLRLVAEDFLNTSLDDQSFDVAVSLEVLSHVPDQPRFLKQIARLLRPRGWLMLATQNRPILERCRYIGPPLPGQVRQWVDAPTLRRLLAPEFELVRLISIEPDGHQGFLRLINSGKLNRAAGLVVSPEKIKRAKEHLMLGHTLMALARKRS
jgi:SAM-dependent methyltransferase